MEKGHIIVCDDEPDIREMIGEYLGRQGYDVSLAEGGAALRSILEDSHADLVVLDINMPGEDGLSLARFLRERGGTGIVMLTASGDVVDRIVGLEMGADDYLAKPVDLRELLARIRAVMRRAGEGAGSDDGGSRSQESAASVRFGNCLLDLEAGRLFREDGEEVPLTAMEFRLLKVFATHRSRVLNRDQLLDLTHGRAEAPFDRSVDMQVSRLRHKIETNPKEPELIKTVRGGGYVFTAAVDED